MPTPAESLLHTARPLVIGHRGYAQLAPENTLPSFEIACTTGVDLVELDYHTTADGIPVAFHDETLDRTTDAAKVLGRTGTRVDEVDYATLRRLDAGSWFHPRFAGTHVPTLEASIAAIHARWNVTLIEHKHGSATALADVLRRGNWIGKVIVISFHWDFIQELHSLLPEQILGALGPQDVWQDAPVPVEAHPLTPEWIDRAEATGAKLVVWNHQVSPEAIAHAHAKGLKVWIYTIDTLPQAQKLITLGVDAIISNNPSIIWKALATR